MRTRITPPRCNGVELIVDGQVVSVDWNDCGNSNCSTSKANPDND